MVLHARLRLVKYNILARYYFNTTKELVFSELCSTNTRCARQHLAHRKAAEIRQNIHK
jgi:hypothetical protein